MANLRYLSIFIVFAFANQFILARPLFCNLCLHAIDLSKSLLTSDFFIHILQYYDHRSCLKTYDEQHCSERDKYVTNFEFRAQFSMINSEEICINLDLCNDVQYEEDSNYRNISHILRNTKPFTNYGKYTPSPAKTLKFVLFADVHIDHDYMEGKPVNCKNNICCRKDSKQDPAKPDEKAGKFGHAGRCDLPWATVDSFLHYSTENIRPDFILYLGDNPAHNTWQQDRETHLRGLHEVAKTLQDLYKEPVYPLLGNHEGYPCDQFDVDSNAETHNWITKDVIKTWEKWLTPEMAKSFAKNGCYSTLYKDTKLRILSITPFVMLADNKYLWGNQTDPLGVVFFVTLYKIKAWMARK